MVRNIKHEKHINIHHYFGVDVNLVWNTIWSSGKLHPKTRREGGC